MENKLKVFIAGQKYFGVEVLKLCMNMDIEVIGVCAPESDNRLKNEAENLGIRIFSPGLFDFELIAKADIGICAHYFGMIPIKALLAPKLGWIGYHPSLLPRHKGRSSIEWALRMKDSITGGSIYWLSPEIDGGDILCQEHCFIDSKLYAFDSKEASAILWREYLAPLGLTLFKKALNSIKTGQFERIKQDSRFETIEPYLK